MCGRFRKDDIYVHLLGATLPQEFMYYKGYDFIKSVDTSNPILVGAKKETYPMFGLLDKPKETMKEFFDKDVMPNIKEIHNNVNYFRNIVNLSK
jgi:hypothetical protein